MFAPRTQIVKGRLKAALDGLKAQESHKSGHLGLRNPELSPSKEWPKECLACSPWQRNDSRCPHSVVLTHGREQQILSSWKTCPGAINIFEHLNYAESMTENQK